MVDPHPLEWTRDGRKLNLAHECEEPFVARLWNSDRELRVSDPFDPKKSKKRESFTKLDFSAMAVSEQLQTPCAILTHVMTKDHEGLGSYAQEQAQGVHTRGL